MPPLLRQDAASTAIPRDARDERKGYQEYREQDYGVRETRKPMS